MNITFHIQRLVIDETLLGPVNRDGLQAALEAELGRLLTAGSLPERWHTGGAVPSLPTGTIEMGRPGDAAHLGTQVAHSVYGAMQGPAQNVPRGGTA